MTIKTLQPETISWDEDYQNRVNPDLMTGLLRKSIPVLERSDWKVVKVEEGYCEAVLPLNKATTNQHGTHQAALISLSADYTGGLALATLLRGVPLAGVHNCRDDESASLWLAGMNVKYKNPSSGHLTCVCRIDAEQAQAIRQRYFRGSRALATLEVRFYSNDELAAVAEMKYFAQPTAQLTPAPGAQTHSTLFSHKLKASARMIAGVRAQTSGNSRLTTRCAYAAQSAGPHGELLASRLQSALPQLKDMVLARTQHIDETSREIPDLKQVVLVGAGLDMRSLKYAEEYPEATFFELDLPEMLAERRRVTARFPHDYSDRRVLLAADFRSDDLQQILEDHDRFNPELPTFFIYEGCSMYFTQSENQRLIRKLTALMQHPHSCLWSDFVSTDVVTGRTNNRHIAAFLQGMESLGESFIFGTDDAEAWLKPLGLGLVHTTRCGDYLQDSDMVFNTYTFAVAKRW